MLSFTGGLKVFIALEPCDMRKGFEGLHAAVCEQLKEQVRGGGLFVFANRRRTRLKILYFDGTGLWLMTKRLEQGTFCWPKAAQAEAFALLTDGIDMHGARPRAWYERGDERS
jgi:transposase